MKVVYTNDKTVEKDDKGNSKKIRTLSVGVERTRRSTQTPATTPATERRIRAVS